MPIGIIIMYWDSRVGSEILATFPKEVELDQRNMVQVYSQHEFSGKAGTISLSSGQNNIVSYYTGKKKSIYIILLMAFDEDADTFEEGLVDSSRRILSAIKEENLTKVLPSIFQRLSIYPTLTDEQRLGMVYSGELNKLILERLREEVCIPKSEIAIWLRDKYMRGFFDLDNVLSTLNKRGLITFSSVSGVAEDLIFLKKDFLIGRIPPIKILNDPVDRHLPKDFVEDYFSEVRGYFDSYIINEEDNDKIISEVFLNPPVYEVLRLLRKAVVTKNDIEKLKKKGVDNADEVLKVLWKNNMIIVFTSEDGREYFSLRTDFTVEKIFPSYNLNTIREQYRSRIKNPKTLIKALEILKEGFNEEQKQSKKKVEA